MIIGLGSVGCYLLDYLVSRVIPQLRLVVVGRNAEKMQMDIKILFVLLQPFVTSVVARLVVDNCDPDLM